MKCRKIILDTRIDLIKKVKKQPPTGGFLRLKENMFKRKLIRVTLELHDKEEPFVVIDDEEIRKVGYEGLRVSVLSNYGNGAIHPTANITIYGLPMGKIDKIIRIRWGSNEMLLSKVKIEVAEESEEFKPFYHGVITFARLDTSNAPDIALIIESILTEDEKQKLVSGSDFEEGTKLADAVEQLATEMGYQFEDNGVKTVLSYTSLNDTNLAKIQKLCDDYGVSLYIENRLIAIAPKGYPRKIAKPIISPSNGLLSYPTSTVQGVNFKCLYNPLIRFGGLLEIKDSIVKMANGDWHVIGLRTHLESNMPNGEWSMEVNAGRGDRIYNVKH